MGDKFVIIKFKIGEEKTTKKRGKYIVYTKSNSFMGQIGIFEGIHSIETSFAKKVFV